MSSRHHIDASHTFGTYVRIWFNYTRGRPAVMYLRNGDPGYPAEPAEINFVKCSPAGFESWAMGWLGDHEDDAIEAAEDDLERDRLNAAEMRRSLP